MYHETVLNLVFPGLKKSRDGISKCVGNLSLAECGFPWFLGLALWRAFLRNFPLQFSRVESAGFKSSFSALAVSLAALRILDENGHKSGRQTCSFFWAVPGSEALTLCACC